MRKERRTVAARTLISALKASDLYELELRGQTVRLCARDRGETIEDGDVALEALRSGIYREFPVERGGMVIRSTWMFVGLADVEEVSEDLASFIGIEPDEREIEEMIVTNTFRAVMLKESAGRALR